MHRAAALIAMGLLTWVGCVSRNASPGGSDGSAGTAAGTSGSVAGQSGGGTSGQGGAAGSGISGQGGDSAGSGGTSPQAHDGGDTTDANDSGAAGGAPEVGGGVMTDGAPMPIDAIPVGSRTNLALHKPATASSVEHAGHEPEMLDDGDQVTRWVGGTAVYPQWNQIDLQTSHRIDTLVLYPYMARAYQFLLEGSLDGTSYFTLSDRRDNTTGGDAIMVSFAAQSARFVRITVVGASVYTSGWTAINELQIYEAQ